MASYCVVCVRRDDARRAPLASNVFTSSKTAALPYSARVSYIIPPKIQQPPFDPPYAYSPSAAPNRSIKSSDRAGDARPRGLHEREEPALASGVIDEQVVRHPRGGVRADAQQRDAKRLEDHAPRRRHEKNRE